MCAWPPPLSQALFAAMSASGLSLLSQLRMGWLTGALPAQPHEPLQQSQYRVVFPEPLWAAAPAAKATRATCLIETMLWTKNKDVSEDCRREEGSVCKESLACCDVSLQLRGWYYILYLLERDVTGLRRTGINTALVCMHPSGMNMFHLSDGCAERIVVQCPLKIISLCAAHVYLVYGTLGIRIPHSPFISTSCPLRSTISLAELHGACSMISLAWSLILG